MGKLKLILACLLIGAVREIAAERITMCSAPEFVDGPMYVEDSTVCSCHVYITPILYCSNMNQDSLSRFRDTFSQFFIEFLIISDSNFVEINIASFENISVRSIFFNQTKIQNFRLFSGPSRLQGPLNSLDFRKCELTNWDFAYLPTFSELRRIDIVDPINTVTDYGVTNYLPNSTANVGLTNCGISSTDQISSLSRLNILRRLILGSNNLTAIERSVFPRPAYKLKMIDLRDNPIVSITEDAFTEMPILLLVDLTNTLLTTLPFNLFQQALIGRTAHFSLHFRILGIPLHCDNKIAWMRSQTGVLVLDQNVICKSPDALAGMQLYEVFSYIDRN